MIDYLILTKTYLKSVYPFVIALNHNQATETVATIFGILIGLVGIQHGIFEILQGNTATNDIMIDAIGPDQRVSERMLLNLH